jgi:hypothetical protein
VRGSGQKKIPGEKRRRNNKKSASQLITQFPPVGGIKIPSTFTVFKVTVVNPLGRCFNAVDFTFQILIQIAQLPLLLSFQ